jgi:selenocysteine-specific elongation factor
MRRLIVGTAGHIDHGKTALVRALTGIDTDRLPEEKRRGITIDLGFANLHLEDDIDLGLVDVPGHEDFIRNMLAGATGIDLVMLVIAADEGVMPQTREHLDILSLLGVRGGIVVISKVDLVDTDWLELVVQDVRVALADSALAEAPVASVSATTGQGLRELRTLLAQAARACAARSAHDIFRMPVDRAFTIRGTGTVVTGTVWSGHLEVGAYVRILPAPVTARVRALQSHEQSVDAVEAGQRAAIALVGIEKADTPRGTTLVTDPHWAPASIITVRLSLLSSAPGLRQRQRVRLHLGTAEVMARVVLLAGNERLEPGASAWAQLRLETPQVARARDRFVIRSYSPVTTIGGGVVVEPHARKRRRAEDTTLERLQNLLDGTDEEAVIAAVELAGWDGAEASALAITTGISPTAAEAIVRDAPRHGLARVADQIFGLDRLEHVQQRLVERADEEHRRNPLRQGISREELIRAAPKGCPEAIAAWCINARITAGQLEPVAGLIRRPGFEPRLTPGQESTRERILTVLADGDLTPADTTALEAAVNGGNDFVALLKLLEAEGAIVALSPDLYLERGRLDVAVSRLREAFPTGRELTPADFREVFGVSRKYLIPLLEHLDKARVTARIGDARRLLEADKPDDAKAPIRV